MQGSNLRTPRLPHEVPNALQDADNANFGEGVVANKRLGPSAPRPRQGTRFVVQALTTMKGRDASPAEMCRRIVESYGGDASRAAHEVDLVVGLNRMLSIGQSTSETLAPLHEALDEPLPLRSQVLVFGWSVPWKDHHGNAVSRAAVRANLLARPHKGEALLAAEARKGPPMGALRAQVARYAQPLQQQEGEERVWSITTDADTIFPLGYFDALHAIPLSKRVVSGGYHFDTLPDSFAHVQNVLDMSIRRSVDPAVPYYPEPSLAVDTTYLAPAFNFGRSKFESRRLLEWLATTPSGDAITGLLPEHLLFSADPRLSVQTDGTRFVQQVDYPTTFSEAMRQLPHQPQSHARTFAWAHQLMAVTGIPSCKLAPLAGLYAVPKLMDRGLLGPESVRAHLNGVDAWFQQRCAGQREPAHVIDQFIDVGALHKDAAIAWHAGKQLRLWADATLDVIQKHILDDVQPWTLALRDDYRQRLASEATPGGDAFMASLVKESPSSGVGSPCEAVDASLGAPLLLKGAARLPPPTWQPEPAVSEPGPGAPARPEVLPEGSPEEAAPPARLRRKRHRVSVQISLDQELQDILGQEKDVMMNAAGKASRSKKAVRDMLQAMVELRQRQKMSPHGP